MRVYCKSAQLRSKTKTKRAATLERAHVSNLRS
jgi:hypothetical protein